MHTLTCPLPLFRRVLGRLAGAPGEPVRLTVGSSCVGSDFVWLARGVGTRAAPGEAVGSEAFLVDLLTDPLTPRALTHDIRPTSVAGRLAISFDSSTASVVGYVATPAGPHPLDHLALVGAGMRDLPCHQPGARQPHEALHRNWRRTKGPPLMPDHWRRTIGALGGEGVWRRLVGLRIGIVGCGRTGSLVAAQLAQLGVRDLLLIDADCLEPHNLGEMPGVRQVGAPKVAAVANYLRQTLAAPGHIVPLARSIREKEAITAAKTRDVLVCAVDNDAGRLIATFVAAFHHKVLIDIGTGVFRRSAAAQPPSAPDRLEDVPLQVRGPHPPYDRAMGADVRVILPGDGCLRCRGGLTDYDNAMRELCGVPPRDDPTPGVDRERAGSLLSLNAMAAAVAVQMLQDLVADRLHASTWAHLDYTQTGQLSVRYPAAWDGDGACALCERAGIGDLGI
jgi:hypothetical protein